MFETGDGGGRVDVLLFIFSKGVLLYHEQHRFWAFVGHKCMGPLTADVLCSNIVLWLLHSIGSAAKTWAHVELAIRNCIMLRQLWEMLVTSDVEWQMGKVNGPAAQCRVKAMVSNLRVGAD